MSGLFVTFTTPEGLQADFRASRIQAYVAGEEGGTRIFLTGALSLLISRPAPEPDER